MISQITSAVGYTGGNPGQASPVAESRPQGASAPAELPQQRVKEAGKADPAAVREAAEQVTRFLQNFDRSLEFVVDEDTRKDVVKVVDTETKDVLLQFPTEEMLAIARALDKLQGLLVRDKA